MTQMCEFYSQCSYCTSTNQTFIASHFQLNRQLKRCSGLPNLGNDDNQGGERGECASEEN